MADFTVYVANDGSARLSDLWIIYNATTRAMRADVRYDYLAQQYLVTFQYGQSIRSKDWFPTLDVARAAAIAWMDYRDGPPQPARFQNGALVSDFWALQRKT